MLIGAARMVQGSLLDADTTADAQKLGNESYLVCRFYFNA